VGNGDLYGPQNPVHGGTKISGDRPRGLSAQGVTNDLATCGPVQDVLKQDILDKIHHWVCGWGLTSVVTLFGLTTGFLLGSADDRRVLPSLLPRNRFS